MGAQGNNGAGSSPAGGDGDAMMRRLREMVAVYEADLSRALRIDLDELPPDACPEMEVLAWGAAAVRTVVKALSHISEDTIELRLRSRSFRDLLAQEFEAFRHTVIAEREAREQ
ncbi:MAG: hypothetical protein ACK4YQ_16820 [Phenylobacterium sp.]|uniref:hypothetical protein n=1 Tax=Phenylobacterium sp. TaxID=1871053 RepID=UPI00391C6B90